MQVLNLPGNGLGKTVACRTHSYYTPSDSIKIVSVFGGPELIKQQLGPDTIPLTANSHIPQLFVASSWFENNDKEVTDFFLPLKATQTDEVKNALSSLCATPVASPTTNITFFDGLSKLNEGNISASYLSLEDIIKAQGWDINKDIKEYIRRSKNRLLSQYWKSYEEDSGMKLNEKDAREAGKSNYEHFMPIIAKYYKDNNMSAMADTSLGEEVEIGMVDQYYQRLASRLKSNYRLSLRILYNKTVAEILVGIQKKAYTKTFQDLKDYFDSIKSELVSVEQENTIECNVPDTLIDTLARIIVSFSVCLYRQEDFADIDDNDLSYVSSFYIRDEQLFKVLLPNSPAMVSLKEKIAQGTVKLVGFYAGSGYGSVILSVNGYNYAAFYTPGVQKMLSYKGLPYIGVAEGGAPVADGFDEPGNDRMITGLYKAQFPSFMYGEYRNMIYSYVWPSPIPDHREMREVFVTKQNYLPTATLPMLTNRCFIDSIITFIYQCGKGGALPGGISVDVIRALNTHLNNECVGLYGSIAAKSDVVDMIPVMGQAIEDPFTKVFSDAHSTGSLIVTSVKVNGRKVISRLAFTTRITGSRNIVYLMFDNSKSVGNATICNFNIKEEERLKYHTTGLVDLSRMQILKTKEVYHEVGVLSDFISEETSHNNFRL